MSNPIRVFVVDDSRDILDLLRRMIDSQPDLKCVGAAESTVGLEEAVTQANADVAVIDLTGPGRDGLEAIRSTAAAYPECRLIAFSGYDDFNTIQRVLAAGATTLVSKNDEPSRLFKEIRRAFQTKSDA